ncbi:MAG: lactate racemase domain-containing protein [Phycisphaeraceae bacterium]
MSHYALIAEDGSAISDSRLYAYLDGLIERLEVSYQPKRMLILPPDITRLNSRAGVITAYLWDRLHESVHIDIMPALGTHFPMTKEQALRMFGPSVPYDRLLPHRWRTDLIELGEISAERIAELSGGRFREPMQVAVNRQLFDGNYDLILSVGQVVPHEVIGLANYTKNILVGVGGKDTINKSHFLGAVCGMESIMGRADTPVRRALNEAFDRYLRDALPIHFVLTVVGTCPASDDTALLGLFDGRDNGTFEAAAELSRRVNFKVLDEPIHQCVVFLDPEEFHSTWLGNKAIYRTRMAMADDGELIVLAPGVRTFGEDPDIDQLIRRHGYRGTPQTLRALEQDPELASNLSAAAHLIHGSSEGRFRVTYCTKHVSREQVESVGYSHLPYDEALARYHPNELTAGWNTARDGERFYYIPNPALGLWASRDRLKV